MILNNGGTDLKANLKKEKRQLRDGFDGAIVGKKTLLNLVN